MNDAIGMYGKHGEDDFRNWIRPFTPIWLKRTPIMIRQAFNNGFVGGVVGKINNRFPPTIPQKKCIDISKWRLADVSERKSSHMNEDLGNLCRVNFISSIFYAEKYLFTKNKHPSLNEKCVHPINIRFDSMLYMYFYIMLSFLAYYLQSRRIHTWREWNITSCWDLTSTWTRSCHWFCW